AYEVIPSPVGAEIVIRDRACTPYWGWTPSARFGERGKYVWCELVAA
ncbi:ATP-binding protein, partial [Streptomyces scabiei]|nr:ATP-binding protein [Streptomyces scabiei]